MVFNGFFAEGYVLEEGSDAELVQIDARLVDQVNGHSDQRFMLRAGHTVFGATLSGGRLPLLNKGSLLRVTGIVQIEAPASGQSAPRAFSLLLRSPGAQSRLRGVLRPGPTRRLLIRCLPARRFS